MGGTIGKPPEPEDERAPNPTVTVEEFRTLFTEDMRSQLCDGLDALRKQRVAEVMKVLDVSLEGAQTIVRRQMRTGMRALQLIAALHPIPYGPIGEGPQSL